MPAELLLASRSPRRAELLRQIGVPFQQVSVDVDESISPGEEPADYVQRLARAKALAGARQSPGRWALGSDTSVVLDHRALGKPLNEDDALRMLLALSGRTHLVLTAVALTDGIETHGALSESEVTFRTIPEHEAQAYWRTGEPSDKAGGYAIQGLGAVFVEDLSGSYSAVVGLPLFETARLLRQAGLMLWQR